MAGRIVISTLNDDTGILATQNGMRGIAKAWVLYNSSSQTVTSSYNVSSVTYNGTGTFTVNFTTAFANNSYATVATTARGDNANGTCMIALGTNTTTSIQIKCVVSSSTLFNDGYNSVVCFSS